MRGAALLLALGLVACREAPAGPPEMGPPPALPTAKAALAARAVIISVDGLRADALAALGPQGAPTLHRLVREGAATLNARPDPHRPKTLPGHHCMLYGRPTLGPNGHKYTGNRSSQDVVHAEAGRTLHSAFDQVHATGGTTALFASKLKLAALVRAHQPALGGPTRPLDQVALSDYDDDATVRAAAAALGGTTPPTLALVHFAAPDKAGHRSGFDPAPGTAYLAAVKATDGRLARLLAALPPGTAVVWTTDHGGHGRRHGDPDDLRDTRIPFGAWGPGVAAGAELYALNPSARRDPGQAEAAGGEPIRNCEAGNLALRLVGRPPTPGSVFNARQDLALRPGG
ncbi:MAG: alkaline phosphatase family protein [Myxococcales bacterium]|nr:alkaline phosphatase family protein [Myxococcales bacterium]